MKILETHKITANAWLVMLALWAATTSADAASLVQNGGFETNASSTSSYPADWTLTASHTGSLIAADITTPVATQVTSYDSQLVEMAIDGITPVVNASPAGGNYFMMDAGSTYDGTLSQKITGLVAGQSYNLSFYQTAGLETYNAVWPYAANATATVNWQVSLGNEVINATVMTISATKTTKGNYTAATSGWQEVKLYFTATSSTETLSFFASGSGSPPMAFLDGVTLASSVPEPEQWTLLLFGFPMLALINRRQQTSLSA